MASRMGKLCFTTLGRDSLAKTLQQKSTVQNCKENKQPGKTLDWYFKRNYYWKMFRI